MNGTTRYTATGLHNILTRQGRMQRWLALQIGTSESAMSKIVWGKRTVGKERAETIARIVGVPVDDLFMVPQTERNVL